MRILGLDVGEKTIGVAISDPLGLTAQGVEVIRRQGDGRREIERLAQLVALYDVKEVVVGLPLNMNGTCGARCAATLDFVKRLEKELNLPVKTWDERLSTVAAERILLEGDLSRARRKRVIDKVAAVLILQGYLDSRSRQMKNE